VQLIVHHHSRQHRARARRLRPAAHPRLQGKPVITATQMLESMIVNARPTRAECSDVANAVLDGTDAVMLSGETANGQHPFGAVNFMSRVCCEAEGVTNYAQLFAAIRESTLAEIGTMTIAEAIASSAVKTAIDMAAKVIIVCSETGNSARLISKYRPAAPILVLTTTEDVARNISGLCRGATVLVLGSLIGTDSVLARACDRVKEWGWVKPGDCAVAVHGTLEGRPGSTNLLKVLHIE
jgi:pyruvate kinase